MPDTVSWSNDRALSRFGVGFASFPDFVAPVGLRLRDGRVSRRELEPATYDSLGFRFIAANDHPDHDTTATSRRRFSKEIETLLVEALALAR